MESFNANRSCSFCNTVINDDRSICDECMITYNIKTSDPHNDGCAATRSQTKNISFFNITQFFSRLDP